MFLSGYTAYFDGVKGRDPNGQYSSITGTEVLYGHCPSGSVPALSPPGWGGINGQSTPGAVIIRVPREHDKAGFPPGPFDTTTLRDKIEDRRAKK